jgi:hypothetical protein
MIKCPYCGKPLKVNVGRVHPGLGPGWDYQVSQTFETPGPYSGPVGNDFSGPVEASRTAPARAARVESDFTVPALQSLATGVVIALPVAGLSIWLKWPWYSFLVAGGGVIAIAWLNLLGAHRKLLWVVETVTNLVEGDPAPPAPQPAVSLEIKHEEAGRIGRMQFVDLPQNVTHDQLVDWAGSVAAGAKTPARSNWVGPGKSFSRDTYDAFTKSMVEAGILAAVPGKGNRLTTGGRHALKSLLNS